MKLYQLIGIGLLGMGWSAKAQLTHGNEQFLFNPVFVNPALAGMHHNQAQLGYDARWVGINDAPQTGYLAYDRFFNDNTGWNISVTSDRIGPVSSIIVANSFAFHVKTSAETRLAFGLRHHLTQSYLRLNSGTIYDITDPLLAVDQTGVPVNNFDASVAFMNPNKFLFGFSYRNLIPQPRFRFTNTVIEPVLSLHGWYAFDFGSTQLETFALASTSSNTPLNLSMGAMLVFSQKIGAGLNFSPNNQAGIFAYVKASDKLNVFYNYNLPISDIAKASKQSHGVGVSFRFGNEGMKGNTFLLQPTTESARTRMF